MKKHITTTLAIIVASFLIHTFAQLMMSNSVNTIDSLDFAFYYIISIFVLVIAVLLYSLIYEYISTYFEDE